VPPLVSAWEGCYAAILEMIHGKNGKSCGKKSVDKVRKACHHAKWWLLYEILQKEVMGKQKLILLR
jgi:hypothetical protein